jgi:predicted acyltransferase
VDALRGFDMFWILGGDLLLRSFQKIADVPFTQGLAMQMSHCDWDGFRFYDLIFPMFVFIVGISIPFSLPKIVEREGKAAAARRIAVRSILLFVLGVIYMGGVANGFKNLYFAGVLQRIAVAYFFAALLFLFFKPRSLAVITIALLAGYWALLTFVPVPGIGAASYEQGKSLAFWIDQNFMPGKKFEGTLLSTMAAVANCTLGIYAGLLLQSGRSDQQKVRWLLFAGVGSLLLGYLWNLQFPIIKLLWTSTYVLMACGWSAVLLAVFHYVIAVRKLERWAQPFVWIGMNAITIYLASAFVNFGKLADRFVGGDVARSLGSYAEMIKALVIIAMVIALVRFLYQRRIFLRF